MLTLLQFARAARRQPTLGEDALWQALRRNRLGVKFRRQHPIPPYIVDFACLREALIVEVDGPHHDRQRDDDEKRQRILESRGYQVLRVTADEAADTPERVIERIEAFLKSRTRH